MRTILRIAVLAFCANGMCLAGCGDELSDPDTFCCALKKLCDVCGCTDEPEFRTIANAEDGDACRFILEDNQLACGTGASGGDGMNEEQAIAACVK